MGSPHEGSIRRPIAPRGNALTTELHLAPGMNEGMFNDTPADILSSIIKYQIRVVIH